MQVKAYCWNHACGRAMLVEEYDPGMIIACPFCGKTFSPMPPGGEKLVLSTPEFELPTPPPDGARHRKVDPSP